MATTDSESLGIYIHIPYCRLVCPYCDFVKRGAPDGIPDAFIDALCREIAVSNQSAIVTSIFFGGGTPSMLRAAQLERVLDAVTVRFRIETPEISLETNPDDVTAESAREWAGLGITRLSLGVQSFDDAALRYLGRIHDAAAARRACDIVAERFECWGVDLIFGAGSNDAWTATLAECRRFDPPHVSAYGLTYEQGTPFWKQRHEAIEDDDSLNLFRETHSALDAYDHYEVSNYAKDGWACRHNQIYWRNESYLGFGPGAYSFRDGVRSRNLSNIRAYIESPLAKEEELRLSDREIRVETLIQHFRTRRGLDRAYYQRRFGTDLDADFGAPLKRIVDRGLLRDDGAGYRPTTAGYELNDEIGLALVG